MRALKLAAIVAVACSTTEKAPAPINKPDSAAPSARQPAKSKPPVKKAPPAKKFRCKVPEIEDGPGCGKGMARVENFCIDRFENFVYHRKAKAAVSHNMPLPERLDVLEGRSGACMLPQMHVSQLQADILCRNAGKRLCRINEMKIACRGTEGPCNEGKFPHILTVINPGLELKQMNGKHYNDPRIGEVGITLNPEIDLGSPEAWIVDPELDLPLEKRYLTRGGEYAECSSNGVYDLQGNISEWTEISSNPKTVMVGGHMMKLGILYGTTFSHRKGLGCNAVDGTLTRNAALYSTGFRCCADGG